LAQEFNLRAGTLATYQIFSLAIAVKEMVAKKQQNFEYVLEIRRVFLDIIQDLAIIKINKDIENIYPGILIVTFLGVKGEKLLA
ncbi:IscS subfamily cysteine desulfurase, partial [Francisella tularensis subsp. holarctica]|nr:IscS subfamily cysteine desulfurase [Francisella tularensis subsp. holarctica]